MLYAITKDHKILELEIDTTGSLKDDLREKLSKILHDKWIDADKRKYDMDYYGDDIFEAQINKVEAKVVLQTFVNNLEKKEDFEYLKDLQETDLQAIVFLQGNYLCIQKDRIIKHLNKKKATKNKLLHKLSMKNDKFCIAENIITISIKDSYDAVISINPDNSTYYSIYFNSPQDVVLHNILNIAGHNPYKYNDEKSIINCIKTTAHLCKHINVDSSKNIIVDAHTKRKLNKLLGLNEDIIRDIINMLKADEYKDKNYIIDDKLFFPKDKKEFKSLIKIIFTKVYLWEKRTSLLE